MTSAAIAVAKVVLSPKPKPCTTRARIIASIESKIKAIMYTTKNQREYEILNQFIKNEFTLESLNKINIRKTQTFRYFYHLLDSKDKIDF